MIVAVQEISITQLAALIDSRSESIRVIDVREAHEYSAGHIPGAVNVPLSIIVDNVDAFRGEGELYVVCQLGGRSAKACEFLSPQGVVGTNVAGGTGAWIELGRPVVDGLNPG